MATTTCQVVGLLLSLLGLAGCIAATGMDMWSTQDLYDNPVTSVFQYEGLWRSCVQQSSGFTECRPYFTILGLPVPPRLWGPFALLPRIHPAPHIFPLSC
ncbi:Claudin-18 [Microtus ochrogaster]|uniref:Claudin n=1 Tax=Microtus ochrogaster TaxID=79684 RepID=A0A8J6GYA7_MICOH|nr:Claudin-18 [Microtus ochrogaster]